MKSFFLILTFVFGSTAEVTALDLQPIPESQIEYGCGCGYLTKPPMPVGPVVQTGLSFEEPRAFIAGRLVPLDPVEVEPLPATPEVGGVFTQHYRYRDADFYFVNTITFVCPRDPDGGCEVTRFDARLTVEQGDDELTLSLDGDCGC